MKKTFLLLILALSACSPKVLTPWTQGGFDTGRYRNLFVEMGYSPKAVDAKVQEVFEEVFFGPNRVYF